MRAAWRWPLRVGTWWSLALVAMLATACAAPAPPPTPAPAATKPTPIVAATPATAASPPASAPTSPSPGAASPMATPPAAASPAAASPVAAPGTDVGTAGVLAAAGREVYAQQCAVCHGDQGQGLVGPAVWGPRANLGKYATAQGLFDYTQQLMPQNAPGSLSPEQYLQVVASLLVQDNAVPPDAPLSPANLQEIRLQR